MLPKMLSMLPAFLSYLAVAIVLLAAFLLVYINTTPYDEFALIRPVSYTHLDVYKRQTLSAAEVIGDNGDVLS